MLKSKNLFDIFYKFIILKKVYILLWNKVKTPDEDPEYVLAME